MLLLHISRYVLYKSVATPLRVQGVPKNPLTLKKKFIYNNLNFFICLPFKKKKGTLSSRNTLKIFMPNKFWIKILKKKKIVTENLRRKKKRRWKRKEKRKKNEMKASSRAGVREKIQKKKKKRKRQEKRLKKAPEPLKIEETWELWKWEEEGVVRWDEK